FQRHENTLGLRSMALSDAPRFPEIDVEGVFLSIQPDYLVDADGRVGAGILRLAKKPDPDGGEMEDTRRRRGYLRREMGHYLVALLQLLLEAQNGRFGIPDRHLCFVADVRLGERIGPAPDHTARLRAVRGACRQIVALWPRIVAKTSILRK